MLHKSTGLLFLFSQESGRCTFICTKRTSVLTSNPGQPRQNRGRGDQGQGQPVAEVVTEEPGVAGERVRFPRVP